MANISFDQVENAVMRQSTSLDNPGICLACHSDIEGVDPDACNDTCEVCGENQVFGAQEILMQGLFE